MSFEDASEGESGPADGFPTTLVVVPLGDAELAAGTASFGKPLDPFAALEGGALALEENTPDIFRPPAHAMPPETTLASLEIEERRTRELKVLAWKTFSQHRHQRRNGCRCTDRHDVFLDDNIGGRAWWGGAAIGVGTVVLASMAGMFFTGTLGCGAASVLGFLTTRTMCMRCTHCRRKIIELDEDEDRTLRGVRRRVVMATATMAIVALVCAVLGRSRGG